ncbi:hypothetical protein AYO47_02065 [Planctomyces sp. SCGC AG-212-M04]|nr:hypothetical protein AYO47_02065 [Planctomyces sp. SCGC AG-212-M04]
MLPVREAIGSFSSEVKVIQESVTEVDQPQRRPVAQIAVELTGRRPAPATVWRLIHKGVRGGIKLQATMCFGVWMCSKEEFLAFLREQTAAALKQAPAALDETTDARLRKLKVLDLRPPGTAVKELRDGVPSKGTGSINAERASAALHRLGPDPSARCRSAVSLANKDSPRRRCQEERHT